VGPVVERLLAVLRQVGASLLHLDQDDGFPDVVRETRLALLVEELLDALLERAAGFLCALLAEGAEEPVNKNLRLSFLVARNVGLGPVDEVAEAVLAREMPWPFSTVVSVVGLRPRML
jgi:hypothetical protein